MSKTNVQNKIAIIFAYPGKTYEKIIMSWIKRFNNILKNKKDQSINVIYKKLIKTLKLN